jgi:hypothetical protein
MPFTPYSPTTSPLGGTQATPPQTPPKSGGFMPVTAESLASMQTAPKAPLGQPKEDVGLFKGIAQDATKTLITKPVVRTAQLATTIAEPFLSPQSQEKARTFSTSEQSVDYPGIGKVTVEAPGSTGSEVTKDAISSALGAASYLAPYGKIAGGVEKVITGALGKYVAPAVSKVLSRSVATGLGGYATDVKSNIEEGKTGKDVLKPGVGTAVGVTLPLIKPAVKGIGTVAKETLGLSTGTGAGVIGKTWDAVMSGGEKLKSFKEGLGTEADAIVSEARDALGTVIDNRNIAYEKQLQRVKGVKGTYDIAPVKDKFSAMLDKFGVSTNSKTGELDFSRSPGLGRYEKDLKNMMNMINDWGTKKGDRTIVGIDKLKQTIDDFRIGSTDSKKFDAFVTALRDTAKKIPGDNPEYMKLLKDYETSTGQIKEIQKALSLGDKASVDTAFRKLTSSLRTNNEFRLQMIKELDDASDGFLSSKIAGQQMGEILPRGLARQIEGIGGLAAGGAGAATLGLGVLKFIPAALFASPKAVQMMMRAIGIPSKLVGELFNAIEEEAIYRK